MPTDEQRMPKITIIGAGISGLVLGRCLLRHNIKATIFEKARQSAHRNSYGITLHEKSYRPLLKVLGLEENTFRRKVAVDGVGSVKDGLRANRNRFEALLAEGLDVRWEREVESVNAGKVLLAGGESMEGDVVVGADGPHSVVRKAILPDVEFKILPFAAYNGKRRINSEEFEKAFTAGFGNETVLEQKIDNALFQISISDKTKEEVSISYTFSRPAKSGGEDALFRPERSKEDAKATPDELFEEVGRSRNRLNEPLAMIFDPEQMRNDRLLNWLMRTVSIETERLQESASKGIVLMGDSVHAEPILGGHGANIAIDDGMKLAEILSSGGSLQEFYDSRAGAWKKSVEESEVRIREMHAGQEPRQNL